MRTNFLASALLIGVMTVGGPMACAQGQGQAEQAFRLSSADMAITFTTERAKVTQSTNDYFWLRGGSFDGGLTFFHGLGLAANVTAEHKAVYAPGVDVSKIAIMGGPRYTFRAGSKHENRLFVESLFGGVHAFDSIFPTAAGFTSTANSFSLQVGGGWDIAISKNFALRAFEADYVRTSLPDNGTNIQDHLRLAVGVSYHTQRH
ncbi:MAG: outer membrane beta-barrel protein [Terriglobia bacterium]